MQRIALLLIVMFTGCSSTKISRISAALVYGQPTVSIEFNNDGAASLGYRVAGTSPVTVK